MSSKKTIILPEIFDARVLKAKKELESIGFNLADLDEFRDNYNYFKDLILTKQFAENWTNKMLDDYLSLPLVQGLLLLDGKKEYSLVAGATVSTSEVIRAAIRIIGLNSDTRWVSSIFFMVNSNNNIAYTYSDCGVIPEPDVEQLVDIAYNASKFHELLTQQEARVAFLSFSTMGSADHYKVKRVQEAVRKFGNKYPHIKHEGELQFDAAIDENVSSRKINNSLLNGTANIFIFPDLGAANIAYKITQYLAGYHALGPLLCGLSKPVHDLSRGCSVQDIVNIASISTIS